MLYNKKEVGKRAKIVREKWFNAFQADVAVLFKVKQQTISNYENGVIDLPIEVIAFYHAKGIRTDWLLFGEGEMVSPGATQEDKQLTEIAENRIRTNYESLLFERDFDPSNSLQNGCEMIIGGKRKILTNLDRKQVYFISSISMKPIGENDFEIIESPMLPFDPALVAPYPLNELASIIINDESMEPTIKNHDKVVFRNRIIVNNDLHVCRFFSSLMVKRIQYAEGGDIILLSENPKYERQLIKKSPNFEVLGKVIAWAHHHD